MTTLLEVGQLFKRFPIGGSRAVVQAVNGVSLNIGPGETLGLVGESGSGKTTVGRCILGLIEPTSGSIRFRGEDITAGLGRRSRALHGKIQLVFQEPAESLDPRQRIGRSNSGAIASRCASRGPNGESACSRPSTPWDCRARCSKPTQPSSAPASSSAWALRGQ